MQYRLLFPHFPTQLWPIFVQLMQTKPGLAFQYFSTTFGTLANLNLLVYSIETFTLFPIIIIIVDPLPILDSRHSFSQASLIN